MYIDNRKFEQRVKIKGLKIGYLIDKTEVSRATFYKYIKGDVSAPLEFINTIAKELVCTIEYISK